MDYLKKHKKKVFKNFLGNLSFHSNGDCWFQSPLPIPFHCCNIFLSHHIQVYSCNFHVGEKQNYTNDNLHKI